MQQTPHPPLFTSNAINQEIPFIETNELFKPSRLYLVYCPYVYMFLCAFGSFSCLPKIVTKQDYCLTRKPTVYLDTRHFLPYHLYLVSSCFTYFVQILDLNTSY